MSAFAPPPDRNGILWNLAECMPRDMAKESNLLKKLIQIDASITRSATTVLTTDLGLSSPPDLQVLHLRASLVANQITDTLTIQIEPFWFITPTQSDPSVPTQQTDQMDQEPVLCSAVEFVERIDVCFAHHCQFDASLAPRFHVTHTAGVLQDSLCFQAPMTVLRAEACTHSSTGCGDAKCERPSHAGYFHSVPLSSVDGDVVTIIVYPRHSPATVAFPRGPVLHRVFGGEGASLVAAATRAAAEAQSRLCAPPLFRPGCSAPPNGEVMGSAAQSAAVSPPEPMGRSHDSDEPPACVDACCKPSVCGNADWEAPLATAIAVTTTLQSAVAIAKRHADASRQVFDVELFQKAVVLPPPVVLALPVLRRQSPFEYAVLRANLPEPDCARQVRALGELKSHCDSFNTLFTAMGHVEVNRRRPPCNLEGPLRPMALRSEVWQKIHGILLANRYLFMRAIHMSVDPVDWAARVITRGFRHIVEPSVHRTASSGSTSVNALDRLLQAFKNDHRVSSPFSPTPHKVNSDEFSDILALPPAALDLSIENCKDSWPTCKEREK